MSALPIPVSPAPAGPARGLLLPAAPERLRATPFPTPLDLSEALRRRELAQETARAAHAARVASAPPVRRGRALVLVDIENLLGGVYDDDAVRRCWAALRTCTLPGDQFVVAAAPGPAQALLFPLREEGVRLIVGERTVGEDSADRALVDSVDLDLLARRFEWLVVASGDHYFAPLLDEAHGLGLRTWAIGGRGAPSRVLQAAAGVHSRLKSFGHAHDAALRRRAASRVAA